MLPNNEICDYYCLDEYVELCRYSNYDENLQILNFNMRSFQSNGITFSAMLNSLPYLPKIIVMTETWNTESNVDLCFLENYQVQHTYRNNIRGGGVSIFCLNGFNCEKISCLSICNETIESCALKIKLNNSYLVILGIYRPHSDTIENFTEVLTNFLHNSIIQNADSVVVAGDMNINLNNIDSIHVNNYVSCLNSSLFLPVITKPTRFPSGDNNGNPSNLDHIWYNKLQPFQSGILNLDISDHLPTFLHVYIGNIQCNDSKVKIQFRPIEQQYIDNFIREVDHIDWGLIFDHGDISSKTDKFINKLNQIYCKTFPLKIKYISQKRINNPWLTPVIKAMIKEKSTQYKLFRMGIISRDANNRFRNNVNREVRHAKSTYYINRFNLYKHDLRKNWDLLRNLLGSKKKSNFVEELVSDGITFTSQTDIVEKFNDFFTSIANNLDRNLPVNGTSPTSYVIPQRSSFLLSPVIENEVFKIVSDLKITKTQLNHLPVKIFKIIFPHIATKFCKLINLTFSYGEFPKSFKISRISQIYKSGLRSDPSNYRPIASIPYFSKILEKCLCNQLVSYFDNFSLFTNVQYGFRKKTFYM